MTDLQKHIWKQKLWAYDIPQWVYDLYNGIDGLLQSDFVAPTIDKKHTKGTPIRFIEALIEHFSGVYKDPKQPLKTGFKESTYSEMVFVNNIYIFSRCAHHLEPFVGKAHFAYIPKGSLVGLSKIPRMIQILAKRPQIQEKLSQEIVDTFWSSVHPKGCGVTIDAYHFCVCSRGIKEPASYTKTTALKGNFLRPSVKSEFLSGAKSGKEIWL